jgi:hypothetical protein
MEKHLRNSKKGIKILNDKTKHYPNKDEMHLLRKIKAETGLSEEEIRADKKYRKMLSEAQKQGQKGKKTEHEKFYQNLIKEACKKTGLVPQHPDTLTVLDEIIKERGGRNFFKYFHEPLTTGKSIVKYYAK